MRIVMRNVPRIASTWVWLAQKLEAVASIFYDGFFSHNKTLGLKCPFKFGIKYNADLFIVYDIWKIYFSFRGNIVWVEHLRVMSL